VFLLQAQGRRRWRIGAQTDLSLVDGMPLKILRNFQPDQEFVLEPGDMLYLPPHYAHDGVAEGECMTYSIGFRAPAYQELGEGFLQFMADSIDLPDRYRDPDLAPSTHPAEIGKGMLDRIVTELSKIEFARDDITIFVGEHLSEPKPNVFFESPEKSLTPRQFAQAAGKRGVALGRKTRMLYRAKYLFINGESFVAPPADRPALNRLADERRLDGPAVRNLSADALEALHVWLEDGWLQLG